MNETMNNVAEETAKEVAVQVVKKIDWTQIGVEVAAIVGIISLGVGGVFGVKKLIGKIKKKDIQAPAEDPEAVEESAEKVSEEVEETEEK